MFTLLVILQNSWFRGRDCPSSPLKSVPRLDVGTSGVSYMPNVGTNNEAEPLTELISPQNRRKKSQIHV